jgi:hypothetical protein
MDDKGGDVNNAIVVVDTPVTESQLDRLSKHFGKETFSISSEGYLNNSTYIFPMNRPGINYLIWSVILRWWVCRLKHTSSLTGRGTH